MQHNLKLEKSKLTPEVREEQIERYLNMLAKEGSYNDFKSRVYSYLVDYKERKLSMVDKGVYKGVAYPEFLPESYWKQELPEMLYSGIRETVADIQKSVFKYKFHIFAHKHVASSQTACVNLFVPVLESPMVNEILRSLDACPKDFKCIAKEQLYHGYRFEFWDSTDEKSKGLLGDHSKQAGTDSDIAIAYYNTNDELCLWLIEHKLTEQEFTACGAYRSKGNTTEGKEHCQKCTLADIAANPDFCYYHRVSKYKYWDIMNAGASAFYQGEYDGKGCPFRGGMNQLWRNQLLAMALEKEDRYKHVSFSVVHHPDNRFLNDSMEAYAKLTNHSPKFNNFTSDKLIDAAQQDPNLKDWIDWYREVYYGVKR